MFIVGCPRSGTTWLYHILLSAGGFAIYRSETQIYSVFSARYGRFSSAEQRSAFLRRWLRSEHFLRSGLSEEAFYVKAMEQGSSPGAMLRVFMEAICEYQGAVRWAECTPDNAIYLRQIKRDFPDALFLHVLRDGRDVARSLARQGFIRPFPWHRAHPELAAGAYWRWIVDLVERESCGFHDDLLTVRYERLIENLERTLGAVSNFIGQSIDIDRVMTYAIGSITAPNSSFPEGAASLPSPASSRASDPFQTLEAAIGDALEEHGYARHGPVPPKFPPAWWHILGYSARFRAATALKTYTFLGRLRGDEHERFSEAAPAGDPTLRPGAHLADIKKIVRHQR